MYMNVHEADQVLLSAYDVAREDLLEHLTSGVHSDREASELTDTFEATALQWAGVKLRTYADRMDADNEALRWEGAVHFRDAASQLERTATELLGTQVASMDESQRMTAALAEVAEIASIGGVADTPWKDGYALAVKELRGIFAKYGLPIPEDH